MRVRYFYRFLALSTVVLLLSGAADAQSSRPRRVQQKQGQQQKDDSLLLPQPTPTPAARNNNVPLLDVKPVKPVADAPAAADTTHAYALFEQKQYAAAAREAKQLARTDSQNSEAWKLAGFSELALKQYADASSDLQKALDLQRAAKQEDPHTVDALAQAYVLAENFDRALPLLVKANPPG